MLNVDFFFDLIVLLVGLLVCLFVCLFVYRPTREFFTLMKKSWSFCGGCTCMVLLFLYIKIDIKHLKSSKKRNIQKVEYLLNNIMVSLHFIFMEDLAKTDERYFEYKSCERDMHLQQTSFLLDRFARENLVS